MIAMARRDYPGIRFEVGSMTDLDLANGSVAGYSPGSRSSTFLMKEFVRLSIISAACCNPGACCCSASTPAIRRR
jgi:hypothetical protein